MTQTAFLASAVIDVLKISRSVIIYLVARELFAFAIGYG
jgi:hypothetical protein